ncbi:MAG: murein biosynthesis integral membrane protein MurJ [Desulfuromonadales bacterium]|nr:murein biosynthesis integral membrane protein MurJ [Desulfuromonadales bacterium]
MSEKRHITRAVGSLGSATLVSRIAGLVRDMVIASQFGAGLLTDAFFMAFTLPNLLRRFFAEGSLTAAFVPTYTEVFHTQGEAEARRVATICWTLLLLVMFGVTIVGMLASPLIVKGIGYGFQGIPGKLELTTTLTRVMFPFILFVSLLSLVTGILNVRGHYFLPAFSPVFLNLSMIGCTLLLSSQFEIPIMALAIGVLLGGLLQLGMQFPLLFSLGYRPSFNWSFRHPAVVRITRLMLPGIAGVAIYQINIVVSRLLASFLPQGSVSYLYYGQRLFEFPQGIVIASLAQALLPAMSRQMTANDTAGFKDSLRFSFEVLLLLILPATIGLILFAVPVYSLFFMSGQFSFDAVSQSSYALMAYAPGLLFVGVSRVVVPAFYSLKDTRTPVWISFWTLIVNLLAGIVLMQRFSHVGLAIALTIASLFNALVLIFLLRRRIGTLSLGSLTGSFVRILPGLILMALVTRTVLAFGDWENPLYKLQNSLILTAAILLGGIVYLATCRLFGVAILSELRELVRRKQRRE